MSGAFKRRRIGKWLSWLLVTIWFFLMLVVVVWITVPLWLAAAWNRILPEGAGTIEYREIRLSPWRTSVEGFEWSRNGLRIEIGSMEVSMSLRSLMAGEVESILVQGLLVHVSDPSLLSSAGKASGTGTEDSSDNPHFRPEWLQFRLPSVPVGRLLVSGFEVTVGGSDAKQAGLDGWMGFRKQEDDCHLVLEAGLGQSLVSVMAEWEETSPDLRIWLGVQGESLPEWASGMVAALGGNPTLQLTLDRIEGGLKLTRNAAGEASLQTQWMAYPLSFQEGAIALDQLGIRLSGSEGLADWEVHANGVGLKIGESLKAGFDLDGSLDLDWHDPLRSLAELTLRVDSFEVGGVSGGDGMLRVDPLDVGLVWRTGSVELDVSSVRVSGFPLVVAGAHVLVEDALNPLITGEWKVDVVPSIDGLQVGDGSNAPIVLSGSIEWDTRVKDVRLPLKSDSKLEMEPVRMAFENDKGKMVIEPSLRVGVESRNDMLRAEVSAVINDKGTRWQNLSIREMDAELLTSAEWSSLDDWLLDPISTAKRSVSLNLTSSMDGTFDGAPWAVESLRLFRDASTDPDSLIRTKVASVEWNGFKVSDLEGFIDHKPGGDISHRWSALVLDPSLIFGMEGVNPASDRNRNELRWELGSRPGSERTHLELNLPGGEIGQVHVDGILNIRGSVQTQSADVKADLEASITSMNVGVPKLDLEMSGVSLESAVVESLIPLMDESPQVLTVESLRFGKVTFTDARVEMRALEDGGLEVSGASVGICGGTVRLAEKLVIRPPWKELHFTVELENVEAAEVAALIPEFQAEVSGKLGGRVPLMLDDGYIRWGNGYVGLMPGETGRFRQKDTRWLDGYLPDVVIDPKRNIRLNEAVQDMVVTGMRLDLVPTGKAEAEPSILLLQGHSFSKDTRIPIEGIRINLRGDIEEGLNLYLGFDKKLKQGASF